MATYCDSRLGGLPRWYIGRPKDAKMRVPDELLECVCFLAVKVRENGTEVYKYGGTGFFVQVPSEEPNGGYYIYFITARHCVKDAQEYGTLYLRANTRDGGARVYEVKRQWLYPNDPASDVAVMPWAPPLNEIQYRAFPLGAFVNEARIQEHGIGVGDDLVITGLFRRRSGNQRNIPIVRTGIIAAMPHEPLEDDDGREYQAYLAEVRSIGGLSGSPVFVFLNPGRFHAGGMNIFERHILLLGLVRGHWDYKRMEGGVPLDFAQPEMERLNMGVAVITPIQSVTEVIEGEVLVKDRRRQDTEQKKKNQPTEDSGFSLTRDEFFDALKKVSRKTPDVESSET